MPFEPLTVLLAIVGLLIGAVGTWYFRRALRGPRLVLPESEAPDTGDAGDRLVDSARRAQTSRDAN